MAAPAIQVENLSKRFQSLLAVDAISFEVPAGSVTALLGGNGAGKTTTLSMLLGLLIPTSGRVTVLGIDMARQRHRALQSMNFTSPYVDLPRRLTVAENLRVYAHLYGLDRIEARLDALARSFDLDDLMDRTVGTLSAGQKTRVSLAKALVNDPVVLLLDEPTASLDPDTADWVRRTLLDYQRRSGATFLLASHNMTEVERLCDNVLMMRAGRLVDRGAPGELIARYGRTTLEEVFLDIAREGRRETPRAAQ
ncbi:MAG: ABC transporter ATP-binding protein [Alphaproteobacteria bacterium]